jgi:hypothetical protein
MNRRHFVASRRAGRYDVRLDAAERALLARLPAELTAALAADGPAGAGQVHPSLARLSPPAYPRDETAETAYRAARQPELLEHHRAVLAYLERSADATSLDAEGLAIWCSALNDLRLVLGTALQVTEEAVAVDEHDPSFREWVIYGYLTELTDELVELLAQGLPEIDSSEADLAVPDDPWGEPPGDLRWDGTTVPSWPPKPDVGRP